MKIRVLCVCLFVLHTSVHAEDWKVVGFIEPIQLRISVEMDSVVDRDKFHTANMKEEGSKGVTTYKALCKEPSSDLALQFTSDFATSIQRPLVWEKEGQKLSMSVKTLKGIFNAACKKSWEFWK